MNKVLKELFSSNGNELFLRKAADYVFPGEELSFFEVQMRCRHRNEILIGWRIGEGGVPMLNPPGKGVRKRWGALDMLVVMAGGPQTA